MQCVCEKVTGIQDKGDTDCVHSTEAGGLPR